MLLKAAGCIVSYWFEQMNYTYKKIWLIAFPVMMSILIEQLINITDALFLGHVGDVELGASALAGIWFLAIYMLGRDLLGTMNEEIEKMKKAVNIDYAPVTLDKSDKKVGLSFL